jgi:hypothetical protein
MYYLSRYDFNTYKGKYFTYKLNAADDPNILSGDYVINLNDGMFCGYTVTNEASNKPGVLLITEVKLTDEPQP